MAKLGKKVEGVVRCMCDTVSNSDGVNCECWDGKGNPIVLADYVRLGKKKKGRFTPSPKRFRR